MFYKKGDLRVDKNNQVQKCLGSPAGAGNLWMVIGYIDGFYDKTIHDAKISDAERVSTFVGTKQKAVYDCYVLINGGLVLKEDR